MYESIEQIKKIRNEKEKILEGVYRSNAPDVVYKNQKTLHSMSMSITTDIADVVLPALQKDGVSSLVWPKTTLRLEKLSFISIPTTNEIREKYKECIEKPIVIDIEGPAPEPGTAIKVKKLPLPAFLIVLALQGFAIPIILNVLGIKKWAWITVVNTACMIIEVVKYFDLFPNKNKKPLNNFVKKPPSATAKYSPASDFETMYRKAISETREKNRGILNDWFDKLTEALEDEIKKAMKEQE